MHISATVYTLNIRMIVFLWVAIQSHDEVEYHPTQYRSDGSCPYPSIYAYVPQEITEK